MLNWCFHLAKNELGRLGSVYAQSAVTTISIIEEKYEVGANLEDEQRNWFIYRCVSNNLASYESILLSSPNPGRLVRRGGSGNSALSLMYMKGHLEIVELFYKQNVELENINKEGKPH